MTTKEQATTKAKNEKQILRFAKDDKGCGGRMTKDVGMDDKGFGGRMTKVVGEGGLGSWG